ncbi:phage tail terminator protein [Undibacterium sp. TJN19]|uniref:phage tail terminator protein n=1 Tax=Undibacterium sp. TJN19 TaxID=3413055 RepID=UPI003BF329AA
MDDYLVLEDLLVAQLKGTMPELKAVMTAIDLAGVKDARQVEPAAHVIYIGDDIGEGSTSQGSNGQAQVVTQQWMVVLVVKFAGTVATGKGNRVKAGPLIIKLLKALGGWQPPNVLFRPLRRINAPKVAYQNGFAYYPFAFKTSFVLGKS